MRVKYSLLLTLMHALQSFREPLYLTDRVLQLPDTRTDEQRCFPELFPHLALASS